MTHDDAVAIAKKLKALAEKSTGGENDVATKKLVEFCNKYNLDVDEYAIETIRATVPFANEQEKTLLSSIMCMVMGVNAVSGTVKDGVFIFRCTSSQFEDIVDAFKHYKKIYYDYIDGVMAALIVKNEIVNKKTQETGFQMDEMTEEERMKYESLTKPEPQPTEKTDTSSSTDSAPTEPKKSSADEERSQDRIRRVFMVMEENRWVKKVKSRFFLR